MVSRAAVHACRLCILQSGATAISISGELEINDDFQCDKPVTIQNGAAVLISDYAIFFDSLTNHGTITTKGSGRLHIGYTKKINIASNSPHNKEKKNVFGPANRLFVKARFSTSA